jgi:hypothetical protein
MTVFVEAGTGRELPFEIQEVVLAGYTGRNQEGVRRHIEELLAHGVAAPERVPTLYRVSTDRVTEADQISVLGGDTSGEAEFFLFDAGGELYVGVGSDHTDRDLERSSVSKAKQVCAKVIHREVWRYADVEEHWDHMTLRGYVGDDQADRIYQDDLVSALLSPPELVDLVTKRIGRPLDGVLAFSGTVPLVGELECAPRFAVELGDEEHGFKLRVDYGVCAVEPLDH